MGNAKFIEQLLVKYKADFYAIVDFDHQHERLVELDFSANNQELIASIIDTQTFCNYIKASLAKHNAKFGIGGYMENRTVYARSKHFDDAEGEPRRLHLGVDIWGEARTPVYCFMDAKVHSFAFNNNFGNYGATIVLEHLLESNIFHSLYGHLSLKNLEGLYVGKILKKGSHFCDFGVPEENGHWPPHLHFQLMTNMEGWEGDYPGVAKFSEKEAWQKKIPNANLILRF